MDSVNEVFSIWKTVPQMAEAVGVTHWTAQKWKTRGRIPQTAWPALISAARAKGKDLSAEALLSMHSQSPLSKTA